MRFEVSVADELQRLKKLTDTGYLTPSEFSVQKAALLSLSGPISASALTSAELEKLAEILQSGAISREEFDRRKDDLLWHESEEPAFEEIPPPDPSDGLPPIPSGWEWVLIVAGALVAIGSLLPWEQADTGLVSITRNGFQLGANLSFSVDGLVVMALGAIAALIGITRLTGRSFPRWLNRSPIILGAVILFEGITGERSVANLVANLRSRYPSGLFSVGYGVWLVIVGGAIIAFAGLAGWWGARQQ